MSKQPEKDVEKASDSTLSTAVTTGNIAGSKKTVDTAIAEMIRRTTF